MKNESPSRLCERMKHIVISNEEDRETLQDIYSAVKQQTKTQSDLDQLSRLIKSAYENGNPEPDRELLDQCYEIACDLENNETKIESGLRGFMEEDSYREVVIDNYGSNKKFYIPEDAAVLFRDTGAYVESWIFIKKHEINPIEGGI